MSNPHTLTTSEFVTPVRPAVDSRVIVGPVANFAIVDNEFKKLTPTQFRIADLLASSPDGNFAPEEITYRIWGSVQQGVLSALRTHIKNLRGVLGPEMGEPADGAIRYRNEGYHIVSSLEGRNTDQSERWKGAADGRLEIHTGKLAIRKDGMLIDNIRRPEFKLLATLFTRPGHIFTAEELCHAFWGHYDRHTRDVLRAHLSNLRGKLGEELGDKEKGALRTHYKRGYSLAISLHDREWPSEENETLNHRFIAGERIDANLNNQAVKVDERIVHFTPTEFRVFWHLIEKPNDLVSSNELCLAVWERDTPAVKHRLRAHIHSIRKKLGPELGDVEQGAIRNRRGIGYIAVRDLNGKL
jgi:DNA-binding response OmpR family regulator